MASVAPVLQRPHQSPLPTRLRTAAFGAIVGAILTVTAYGYLSPPSPSPPPASPSLRPPSARQLVGLSTALAADWSQVREADTLWHDACYYGGRPGGRCRRALHVTIGALQRLLDDVSAQPLGGTTLAPVVDARFLPSVGANLAAKRAAARDLTHGPVPQDVTKGWAARFLYDDRDPVICIQPVNAALQLGLGQNAPSSFLSYPASTRRNC